MFKVKSAGPLAQGVSNPSGPCGLSRLGHLGSLSSGPHEFVPNRCQPKPSCVGVHSRGVPGLVVGAPPRDETGNPGIRGSRHPGSRESRDPGIPGFRNLGIPRSGNRESGHPRSRNRESGNPGSGNQESARIRADPVETCHIWPPRIHEKYTAKCVLFWAPNVTRFGP